MENWSTHNNDPTALQTLEWHPSLVVGVRTVIIAAGPVVPHCISRMRAIRMSEKTELATKDAARTTPAIDYARVWEWWRTVETTFQHAD